MSSTYAIIVAGGRGTRMNSEVPKQFLLLNGLPVLMHTLLAFARSIHQPSLLVVLPEDLHDEWTDLCQQFEFPVPHMLVAGGSTRFQSVSNGLNTIRTQEGTTADSLIAVHDAVRPLITPELIDLSYDQAASDGAVVLAIQSTNSVRLCENDSNRNDNQAIDRKKVFLVQTPQTFKAEILFDAYTSAETSEFTDDASVVEEKKYPITLLDGAHENIKITFETDLLIAEHLLKVKLKQLP